MRALKQNASAVVSGAAAGEVVTITDRGRPVAQMGPLPVTRLASLLESGRARPARRPIGELSPPVRRRRGRPAAGEVLDEMRESDRY